MVEGFCRTNGLQQSDRLSLVMVKRGRYGARRFPLHEKRNWILKVPRRYGITSNFRAKCLNSHYRQTGSCFTARVGTTPTEAFPEAPERHMCVRGCSRSSGRSPSPDRRLAAAVRTGKATDSCPVGKRHSKDAPKELKPPDLTGKSIDSNRDGRWKVFDTIGTKYLAPGMLGHYGGSRGFA